MCRPGSPVGRAYPAVFVLDETGRVVQKRMQEHYRAREEAVNLLEDALGIAAATQVLQALACGSVHSPTLTVTFVRRRRSTRNFVPSSIMAIAYLSTWSLRDRPRTRTLQIPPAAAAPLDLVCDHSRLIRRLRIKPGSHLGIILNLNRVIHSTSQSCVCFDPDAMCRAMAVAIAFASRIHGPHKRHTAVTQARQSPT